MIEEEAKRKEKIERSQNSFFSPMAVFEPSVVKSVLKNAIQGIKDCKEFVKNWETHVSSVFLELKWTANFGTGAKTRCNMDR